MHEVAHFGGLGTALLDRSPREDPNEQQGVTGTGTSRYPSERYSSWLEEYALLQEGAPGATK
jgi:hypothetical protein